MWLDHQSRFIEVKGATMLNIKVVLSEEKKEKPQVDQLGFGRYFTDHMFVMTYDEGLGWHDPVIKKYENLQMDPASCVFHYGQEMFEGMKAYKTADGGIQLFRPDMNAKRTNKTNDRICLPELPEEDFVQAVKELVAVDADWIPEAPDTSLYVRPFIIATEKTLNVHPSSSYLFMVILSPVGAYYKEGLNPVKIFVEDQYVRAVKGGVGEAKTGGNYGASLKGQMRAKELGYAQVLWLDAIERQYVEEVGTSNIFFKIDGEIHTPALSGSILPGITRDSAIALLKSWGLVVKEDRIAIKDVFKAAEEGRLEEVFGTGTAAVISPVGSMYYQGVEHIINDSKIGPTTQRVYDTITGIQNGSIEDTFGWVQKVNLPETLVFMETQLKSLDTGGVATLELIDKKKRTIAGNAVMAKEKFGSCVIADVKEKVGALEIRLDVDFPDQWFTGGNYLRMPDQPLK